jgi:hypothetical protein
MSRARRKRPAAIAAASAVFHLVLLSALAIEATRPGAPASPEDTAIQVTLERPPAPIAPPEPKPLAAPRPASTPKPAPLPRSPAPVAAPPSVAARPLAATPAAPASIDAGASAAMGNLTRALRGSVGCSNPDAVGLTPAERDACRRRLHAGLEDAKPLSGLTAEKRARFDQVVHCREVYQNAGVPMPGSPSNGPIAGLGYVPSLRECPPGAR